MPMTDDLIEVRLYSPHVCDFIYRREDGSYYADRRNHGQQFLEVTRADSGWVFGGIIEQG